MEKKGKHTLDKITANEVIESIHKAIKPFKGKKGNLLYNNDLSPKERVVLLKNIFDERLYDDDGNLITYHDLHEIHKLYLEFVEQPEYHIKHGNKKKGHKLSEDDYFCKKLSGIGDYLIDNYDGRFNDYTVISDYRMEQDLKDRKNKRIVGFNTSFVATSTEDGNEEIPDSVKEGLEIHLDMLEAMTKKSDPIYRLSEDEKRRIRNDAVLKDLENYPYLKEFYRCWKEFGMTYGLDGNEYIKQYQILKFENDKESPYTPEDRYYRLQKMYNELGYELTVLHKQLKQPVKSRNYNQVETSLNTDALIDKYFDLGNQKHVTALLSIQQVKNKKGKLEYYPLYYMLHNENENKIDSSMSQIFREFDEVVKYVDLNRMEKDILYLILNKHSNHSVLVDALTNPYILIAEYINKKYGLKKTKAEIIKTVENKISRMLANTYIGLKNGAKMIECTRCRVKKLGISDNFGTDKKKKNGFKSICKKCLAEYKREKKNVI